ncbi:hypothetical protein [Micromonospora sp. SL4-19]|uniref:hypothetical protein n=1 Tax=Micromonospora sp. SL4-19 TaxID=3399129 RepID=UPI003A4E57E5
MRDEDMAFVDLVQRDLRDVRWPEPGEIRARARRRRRRTALVAGVAVLAVSSASAVAVAAHRDAPPTPAGVAGARAEIPAEALLSEPDLPVQADMEISESGLGEPVQVDSMLETCGREHGVSVAPVESRYSRSRNLLRADRIQRLPLQVLVQDVYRLAPAAPGRLFADLDRLVGACPTWLQTTPTERGGRPVTVSIQYRWQVLDLDFAGDRAVLLRRVWSSEGWGSAGLSNGEDLRAVVQVGDLVTVLTPDVGMNFDPADKIDEGQVRDLALTAAERMCSAANPRC